MIERRSNGSCLRSSASAFLILLLAAAPGLAIAEPPAPAAAAFNMYISGVESRLAQQRRSPASFLSSVALEPQSVARLRNGELIIEQLTPTAGVDIPGAMLHDWRGTAFAPGAKAADFDRLMRDYNAYPQRFAPQILQSRLLAQQGDFFQVAMRIRQKHVITVVMDTSYDVTYGRLDPQHGYSISRSTQIREIDSPGSPSERAMTSKEEHGFLWRMNTYWSYEERDGGLYMQIESVTLTRSIPNGFAWVIRPFVESIPRESLEFSLRSTCNALRK
jgi:hypothetical protein